MTHAMQKLPLTYFVTDSDTMLTYSRYHSGKLHVNSFTILINLLTKSVIYNFPWVATLSDSAELSPEIFDPGKMNSNFLDANFGCFRLSTARDDENM